MKKLLLPILLLSLSGCATIAKLATPAAAPLVSVAVDVAVGTAVAKGVKPQLIYDTAMQLETLDTGGSVAVAALEAALQAKIATLKLPGADLLAVNALVSSVQIIISQQLAHGPVKTAAGTVTAQTQIAIQAVLTDVLNAARASGAKG